MFFGGAKCFLGIYRGDGVDPALDPARLVTVLGLAGGVRRRARKTVAYCRDWRRDAGPREIWPWRRLCAGGAPSATSGNYLRVL